MKHYLPPFISSVTATRFCLISGQSPFVVTFKIFVGYNCLFNFKYEIANYILLFPADYFLLELLIMF